MTHTWLGSASTVGDLIIRLRVNNDVNIRIIIDLLSSRPRVIKGTVICRNLNSDRVYTLLYLPMVEETDRHWLCGGSSTTN